MPKKEQKFKMVNTDDPNEMLDLKSNNLKDAALEALEILGWGICTKGLKVKAWGRLIRKINKAKEKNDQRI